MRAPGVTYTMRTGSRQIFSYLSGILILLATVIGGLALGTGDNYAVGGMLAVSSKTSNILGGLGVVFGLGFAFVAGMVATVNPCGFAMLPAYLSLYVDSQRKKNRVNLWTRVLRACSVSMAVGLGFVALFGSVGVVISAETRAIVAIFPWIGLTIGVVVTLMGSYVLGGGKMYSSLPSQTASKISSLGDSSFKGYFIFGISYGVASLSCTLPIFLALISSSLATGGFLNATTQFVFYSLGMAFVVTVLTISLTLAQGAIKTRMENISEHLSTISALMLLLAGGYIVFYWLTEGGLAEKII